MDNYTVISGTSLPFYANLADKDGNSLLEYTGNEDLTGYVTPGKNRPASFLVSVGWDDAPAGRIAGIVTEIQTATLTPGRYLGYVILTDPALGPLVAYRWGMEVLAGPGPLPGDPGYVLPGPDPAVYCTYDDLLDVGRGWLRLFPNDDDDAGFGRIIGKASRWLDELIISRAPSYGSGEWSPDQLRGLESSETWLRARLIAGGLVVESWVTEAVATRAVAMILDGQPESKDSPGYAALARRFRARSETEALSHRVWIRSGPSNTVPDLSIHLGAGSHR